MAQRNAEPDIPVPIPAHIYRQIERRIAGTEFPSVAHYVAYVLREVLEEDQPPSAAEEEAVKRRLRALGYLD